MKRLGECKWHLRAGPAGRGGEGGGRDGGVVWGGFGGGEGGCCGGGEGGGEEEAGSAVGAMAGDPEATPVKNRVVEKGGMRGVPTRTRYGSSYTVRTARGVCSLAISERVCSSRILVVA